MLIVDIMSGLVVETSADIKKSYKLEELCLVD